MPAAAGYIQQVFITPNMSLSTVQCINLPAAKQRNERIKFSIFKVFHGCFKVVVVEAIVIRKL